MNKNNSLEVSWGHFINQEKNNTKKIRFKITMEMYFSCQQRYNFHILSAFNVFYLPAMHTAFFVP